MSIVYWLYVQSHKPPAEGTMTPFTIYELLDHYM